MGVEMGEIIELPKRFLAPLATMAHMLALTEEQRLESRRIDMLRAEHFRPKVTETPARSRLSPERATLQQRAKQKQKAIDRKRKLAKTSRKQNRG